MRINKPLDKTSAAITTMPGTDPTLILKTSQSRPPNIKPPLRQRPLTKNMAAEPEQTAIVGSMSQALCQVQIPNPRYPPINKKPALRNLKRAASKFRITVIAFINAAVRAPSKKKCRHQSAAVPARQ